MAFRHYLAILGLLLCASACASLSGRPAVSRPSDARMMLFARASNAFGLDLYGKLTQAAQKRNVVLSPASISMALAMAWAGARAKTAEQMAHVLRFSGPPREQVASAGRLLVWLNDPTGKSTTLHMANCLFVQDGLSLAPAFLDLTRGQFDAPVELVDFGGAPEAARQSINSLVADQTEQHITEILPPDSVDPMTRLVLTNAVYFLGKWKLPFEKRATQPRPFYANGETPVSVPMMSQQDFFGYASLDGVQLLQLPYLGEELNMLVILPAERNGLPEVERMLTAERLRAWDDHLRVTKVQVYFPRFTVRYESALRTPLRQLGMKLAFDASHADFGGIAADAKLCLKEAYHQVFVKVDEEGTEAAAATALVAPEASAFAGPQFVADHPFLFAIRDARSNSLLFFGRVVVP
jgi:serpin B